MSEEQTNQDAQVVMTVSEADGVQFIDESGVRHEWNKDGSTIKYITPEVVVIQHPRVDKNRSGSGKQRGRRSIDSFDSTVTSSDGKRWYKQRFCDTWLSDYRFKDWVERVARDPFKARCRVCNVELRAGSSELVKHAKTRHHRDTFRVVEDVKSMLGYQQPPSDAQSHQQQQQHQQQVEYNQHHQSTDADDDEIVLEAPESDVVTTISEQNVAVPKENNSVKMVNSDHVTSEDAVAIPVEFGGSDERVVSAADNSTHQMHFALVANADGTLYETVAVPQMTTSQPIRKPAVVHVQNVSAQSSKLASPTAKFSIRPMIQKPAPFFRGLAVIDGSFQEVKLTDYLGRFLVLVFYPHDFTLFTPPEVLEYSERIAEFRALNAEVLAVSTDSHYTHLAWTNTAVKNGGVDRLSIPLLSDFSKKIATTYDCLAEDSGFAFRATYIVDPRGILRHITVNDVNMPRSVGEILRLLKMLVHIDKLNETLTPSTFSPSASESQGSPAKRQKTRF